MAALRDVRDGKELSQEIENIENQLKAANKALEEQNQLTDKFESDIGLSVTEAESKIQKYEDSFLWFGNSKQQDEFERYAGTVCNYIRDELSSILNDELDHITTFTCKVGQPQPFQSNIDTLPLSLNLGTACTGDTERLVIGVDNHPAMLILEVSASRKPEASDQQNKGKITREEVSLTTEFYVLNTATKEQLEAIETEAEKRSLEFDIETTRQELLMAALDAKQGQDEETNPTNTVSPTFTCPTD